MTIPHEPYVNMNDFEYERRFYCRHMPSVLDDGDPPLLIVQSYFVHEDNYALRVRVQTSDVKIAMTADTDAHEVLRRYRDHITHAFVTVKGPAVGGTRYEAERAIDPGIAVELMVRGGLCIIKNRYSAWIAEDGWSIDVFGGQNAPLIVAEAERPTPVTNLSIPDFCVTEITDQMRFSNDGLVERPFALWQAEFEQELAAQGIHFEQSFGVNKRAEID